MAKHIRIVRKRQESRPLQLDDVIQEEKEWAEAERTVSNKRDTTYNNVVLLVQSIKLEEKCSSTKEDKKTVIINTAITS